MRKFLAIILTAFVIVTLIPGATMAEESIQKVEIVKTGTYGDNITWTIDSEGILTLSGSGEMADNSGFNHLPWYYENIKKIIIEEGITSICQIAFGSSKAESAELPESLEKIDASAFTDCKNLININIPENVKTIGEQAFAECVLLKSLRIPKSVKTIGENAIGMYFEAENYFKWMPLPDFVLYGAEGSAAESYADERGITFVQVCDNHIPGEAVEENIIPATCIEEGSYDSVIYCSVCNEELSREVKTIALAEHTECEPVRENEKGTSCTEPGSYDEVVYCSVCGRELSRTHKEAEILGHNFTHYVSDGNATCMEDGTLTAICERCGATDTIADEGSALGHDYMEVEGSAIEAFCTTDGKYADKKCTRCGDVVTGETIPALGHRLISSDEVNKQASFTEDGSYVEEQYCLRCENTVSYKDTVIPRVNTVTLKNSKFTYNKKTHKPDVIVSDAAGNLLTEGKQYTVKYSRGCKNAGTYQAYVTLQNTYPAYYENVTKTISFTINKAPNPAALKDKGKTLSYKKLRKKTLSFRFSFKKKAVGNVTYSLSKAAKKSGIRVSKIVIKGKSIKGRVTVPKGCKKGTYFIYVKAKGNGNYKAKTLKYKVKVK